MFSNPRFIPPRLTSPQVTPNFPISPIYLQPIIIFISTSIRILSVYPSRSNNRHVFNLYRINENEISTITRPILPQHKDWPAAIRRRLIRRVNILRNCQHAVSNIYSRYRMETNNAYVLVLSKNEAPFFSRCLVILIVFTVIDKAILKVGNYVGDLVSSMYLVDFFFYICINFLVLRKGSVDPIRRICRNFVLVKGTIGLISSLSVPVGFIVKLSCTSLTLYRCFNCTVSWVSIRRINRMSWRISLLKYHLSKVYLVTRSKNSPRFYCSLNFQEIYFNLYISQFITKMKGRKIISK